MTELAVAVLTFFAASAALAAPNVRQFADNVHMMSESHCVNLVAVGDDGALITDPAFASQAESLKKAVAKITNKLATRIVLFRERHMGGAKVSPGARIICRVACGPVFALT